MWTALLVDKGIPLLVGGAMALLVSSAEAGSVTANLQVTIQQPLAIVGNPPTPTVACNAPPGTVISTLSVTGGDGNPPTFAAIGGDTAEFGVTGNSVVVGPGGIKTCGQNDFLEINGSQP